MVCVPPRRIAQGFDLRKTSRIVADSGHVPPRLRMKGDIMIDHSRRILLKCAGASKIANTQQISIIAEKIRGR
jgi:hypothetical protein